MKCFVTGAAGFIGSSLCERLVGLGHEVTGIDSFVDYYPRQIKERNLDSLLAQDGFYFVEDDLLRCDLEKLLEGVEVIFHQAGQAGVRSSWGEDFKDYAYNNILATQRLLEACKGREPLKRFVFASSSSVYGDAESYPTSENTLPKPVSPYGVTKLAAENLATLYCTQFGVPTVSLRYFTVYGPRQRPDMAFSIFCRKALCGEEIVIYGDGEQSRDFTYIDDIVEANLLAAFNTEATGVFNIGGGSNVTVNQVLDLIKGHVGDLKVRYTDPLKGEARKTSADITKAKDILGYKPSFPIKEGIKRELEWIQAQIR
ncbi:MAG: NAD-dependent epimerase/dehydratase family protein [Candidatus Dadabacteria bacterium]|nr:MAG: NAD-dependent epimerase/dehydratase family protein [Candidatus Dadabacteria bacterium]